MKKRVVSLFLTVCMLLTLLPTSVFAGGSEEKYLDVHSWSELEDAIAIIDGTKPNPEPEIEKYDGICIKVDDFTWPSEGGNLVIDFCGNKAPDYGLHSTGHEQAIYLDFDFDPSEEAAIHTWNIPSNVTLNFYEHIYSTSYENDIQVAVNGTMNLYGIFGGSNAPSLSVNGTVTTYGYSALSASDVTLNSGGKLDVKGSGHGTFGSLTLNKGCQLMSLYAPWVYGDLVLGEGVEITADSWPEEAYNSGFSVYGNVSVKNGGAATLACDLGCHDETTFTGKLTLDSVSLSTSYTESKSVLNISKGSTVTTKSIIVHSPATVNVNGTLDIAGSSYNFNSSTLNIGEGAVVKMRPEVQFGDNTSNSTITGSGTLELYGVMREGSSGMYIAPYVFGVGSGEIGWSSEEQDYVYDPFTGVADTVKVKRMWDLCDNSHSWGTETVLKPTCCEGGYTYCFCSECGTELRSDYTNATNEHDPVYEAWKNDTSRVGVSCANSGDYCGNVQITAEDAYIKEGEEAKTGKYIFNGGVRYWEGFTWPTIQYKDNTTDGTATAYAKFGDVTISTTFTVSTCAHEGGTATCTEQAVCTKCHKPYGKALGHIGGTATCKDQAVCIRCEKPYGEKSYLHDYVVKCDATKHWLECTVCGLDCYRAGITDASQIDEELFAKRVESYIEYGDYEPTTSQMMWYENLGGGVSMEHYYPSWSPNYCPFCGYQKDGDTHTHTGGTATCEKRAICTTCGQYYGERAAHSLSLHKDKTMHWAECKWCGLSYAGGSSTKNQQNVDKVVASNSITIYLTLNKDSLTADQKLYTSNDLSAHVAKSDSTTCLLCGYEGVSDGGSGVSGSACEHKNTKLINQKDVTCGKDGYTGDTYCNDCEQTVASGTTIPATGNHTSNGEKDCTKAEVCTKCDYVIRAAGSHTSNGEKDCTKAEVCTKCDHVIRAAGNHTSNGEKDCTKAEVCTKCDYVIRAAGNHTSNGEKDCTKAEVCTKCDYIIRAAGSHTSNGEKDCTKAEICTKCSAVIRAAGNHQWNNGVITTQPTVDNAGVKTFTCTVCGATRTEPVEKLKMQEVTWVPEGPITVTYGAFNYVQPTAYNDTVEDCVFTYTSSDESVATVDANGKTTIKGAGTATITATAPAVSGYAETSASYTLTVKKAPLTVTAKDHTIAYGQIPANNGFAVTGLVNGEDESVLTGTPAYTYSCEQYDKVGTYAINLSGLSAKNYEITFVPGTLTVEKAENYTISFKENQLEQVTGHLSDISASVEPYDSTAEILVEYQINNEWVSTLPADLSAGNYPIRASLTASDNIALDGAFTEGKLVVKNGVTVDPGQGVENVEIGVDVEDGKASLDIEDPAQITDKADGDVKINIGGVSGAKELELPAGLMTGLSQNEKADSLTVTTEDASVTLSGAVVDTVASAVKSDEDTVTVRLTSVEKDDLNDKQQAALESIGQDAVIVEVSLIVTHADGSKTELHELNGNAEITVPYDGPVPEGKYIVVSYVSDDGGVSYVRATYNKETKQVSFRTNHFSTYAVFVSASPAVIIEGGTGTGLYAEGSLVTIKADSKSGYTFTKWEIVSGNVTLSDSTKAETTFVMPDENVTLKAVYTKKISGGGSGSSAKPTQPEQPVQPTQPVNPFVDVTADDYFYDAVLWAVEQNVTGGTSATTFSPEQPCTRAQIVTFLWNASGKPEAEQLSAFADVPADAYYAKAVAWAVERGITSGTSATTFSPDEPCTRAQAMTFLYRACGAPAVNTAADFSDVAADAYYASAVAWAVEHDITSGIGGGQFGSDLCCTRAQIVTFLWKAIK